MSAENKRAASRILNAAVTEALAKCKRGEDCRDVLLVAGQAAELLLDGEAA